MIYKQFRTSAEGI